MWCVRPSVLGGQISLHLVLSLCTLSFVQTLHIVDTLYFIFSLEFYVFCYATLFL